MANNTKTSEKLSSVCYFPPAAFNKVPSSTPIRDQRKRVANGLTSVRDSLKSANNPVKNPDFFLISLQNQTAENAKKQISLVIQDTQENLTSLKKLKDQKIEILQENTTQLNNYNTWDTIKNFGSYFGFATSTITGLTACSNPVIGGVLIGSGCIGLVNRMLADTSAWQKLASYFTDNKKSQETIAQNIDQAFALTSAGLGLFTVGASSFLGYGSFIAQGSSELIKKAGTFGSTLISATGSYMGFKTKSTIELNQSQLAKLENFQNHYKNEIKTQMNEIEETAHQDQNNFSKVSSMLQEVIENLKNLTKKR